MADLQTLSTQLQSRFGEQLQSIKQATGELTIEILPEHLQQISLILRDDPDFHFEQLMDVCGVDYLHYGVSEWVTTPATRSGFERGVDNQGRRVLAWNKPRFAVVYHLLSLTHNHRLRIRSFVDGEPPMIDSVIDIWPSANWFEREAFDLFGIIFNGHPDLRRILTDYGFIGHPFRKDFPLIGNVEVRYDATLQRVVYEPVSVESRTLVPKVIRTEQAETNTTVENKPNV